MKFRDLFEMPTFVNKELTLADDEMPDDVPVGIMSQDTLDRNYSLLGHVKNGTDNVVGAISKDKHHAIIGVATTRDDGVPGLRVIVTLKFHPADTDLGEAGSGGKAIQVDTVWATDEARGAGYGYQLYKFLLDNGYTVVSDNVQYIGGKELWKKIIRRAARDDHSVQVLQQGKYIRDANGKVINYNGNNIADDVIWSENKRSEPHYYTMLVARKN